MQPVYFRNCSGLLAVSTDDGETIFLPDGRKIALNDKWIEVAGDFRQLISSKQEQALRRIEQEADKAAEALEILRSFWEETKGRKQRSA